MWLWILVRISVFTIRFFLHRSFDLSHWNAGTLMALELEVDMKQGGGSHLPQYS